MDNTKYEEKHIAGEIIIEEIINEVLDNNTNGVKKVIERIW